MPSDTPLLGYPFPLSSEQIAKGAQNIEDLAADVENSRMLTMNKYAATEPATSYPAGMSVMRVNDGSANALGWPYRYGIVHTLSAVTGGSIVWQWFYQYSAQKAFLRQYTSSWKPWQQILNTAGNPSAMAGGVATLTPPSGGGIVSTVITLPSGVFGNQDTDGKIRIFTTANSSSAGVETTASWTSTGTITSFTLFLQRGTPTATGVYWQAFQGGE